MAAWCANWKSHLGSVPYFNEEEAQLLQVEQPKNFLKFGHYFGQKEAFGLDNQVEQTKSRKEGFHEQVYTSFEVCTAAIR